MSAMGTPSISTRADPDVDVRIITVPIRAGKTVKGRKWAKLADCIVVIISVSTTSEFNVFFELERLIDVFE